MVPRFECSSLVVSIIYSPWANFDGSQCFTVVHRANWAVFLSPFKQHAREFGHIWRKCLTIREHCAYQIEDGDEWRHAGETVNIYKILAKFYPLICRAQHSWKGNSGDILMKSRSVLIKVHRHKCLIDWEPHAQLDFTNLLCTVVPCLPHISSKD